MHRFRALSVHRSWRYFELIPELLALLRGSFQKRQGPEGFSVFIQACVCKIVRNIVNISAFRFDPNSLASLMHFSSSFT
jgi:hypothetical protein